MVDYRGLKVGPINELRKRLGKAGAEMHVVKNSLFRLAVKEAGVVDLGASLAGQLAVVTGPKDISAAAKVVKTFGAEFAKPKIRFGYLKNQRLETADILALADLPSMEVMRGRLLGSVWRRPPNWRCCSTRPPHSWRACSKAGRTSWARPRRRKRRNPPAAGSDHQRKWTKAVNNFVSVEEMETEQQQ